jgi:glycosyltransferase involved in cell wall biosynthesis
MKIAFYLDCVSPHQVPLAREVVKRIGANCFRYVYRDAVQEERAALGWQMTGDADWFVHIGTHPDVAREWIESADVMLTGFRDFELFERRVARGLAAFYMSERWLKPIVVLGCSLPGRVRLLHPRFRRMVHAMKGCFRSKNFRYLPIGVHARKDMVALCGGQTASRMTPWGYFVESSPYENVLCQHSDSVCRILWVGRMIDWKRTDTIVNAIRTLVRNDVRGVDVTLVGNGPERQRLEKLAVGLPVAFHDPVSISEVRALMRQHDVYVLPSDGGEGWGAAVNEALEEGMHVLGTYEAGSSATLLDDADLFHAGDWRHLARLLTRCVREKQAGTLKGQGIGEWSAEKAADRLLALVDEARK